MVDAIDFQPYLESICNYYSQWWSQSVLTDMERQQSEPFNFNLYVREVERQSDKKTNPENPSPLPIVEALHQYQYVERKNHILLVGRPGSGKTKALFRYLLELAERAKDNPLAKIPILVRLKDYQISSDSRHSGIVHLIRKELISLELKEIERYLFLERKFLLLIDGLNESTSPELRKDLQQFLDSCRKRQIPIVLTTRVLGYRNLEVETQLEIQPISPEERQRFLKERVSPAKQQQLQGWLDRSQQSDYTPFVMWMLAEVCEQVNSSSQLENFSLGEAFREFLRLYQDKLYEEGRISDEDCEAWIPKLKHLASEMLSDETSDNFIVFRNRAIDILESEALLNNLIQHHLLVESRGDGKHRKIEFCHQLLQEYYAAEWLFDRLPELSDEQLKYYFLNYLKWTEAIELMLGLINENDFGGHGREQAIRVVKFALKVDLVLGARLAGEVKEEFQEKTIELVNECELPDGEEVPQRFRVELLGRTRSKKAIRYLLEVLEAEDEDVYKQAAKWLGDLEAEVAIPKLQNKLSTLNSFIQESCTDKDITVWMRIVQALGKLRKQDAVSELHSKILYGLDHPRDFFILFGAGTLLGQFDNESILPELFVALEDKSSHIRRANAASVLGQIGNGRAVGELINALADQHPSVRKAVVNALEQFDTEEALSGLTQALTDQHHSVYENAAQALVRMKNQAAVPRLLDLLHHPNCNVSWLAAVVLGHLGNSEAFSRLQQELSNSDFNTRKIAVEALSHLDGQQVISVLLDRLRNDPDYAVRRSAAIALGQLDNEEAVLELLKALRHYYPNEPDERVTTLVNLGSRQGISEQELKILGDENAVQRWLLERNNLDIRIRIAKALANLGTENAISGLFDGLKYSNACTRLAAAIALGQLGKKEAIQELLDALRDVDPNTRKEIITALVKLGNQQIVHKLLELLKDDALDSDTRWSVAVALGQIEGNVTAKYLPDLIKLIPTKVQWQAFWAILGIQEQCKFYNYKITRSDLPPAVRQDSRAENQGQTINNNINIEAFNANNSNINMGGTIQNQISNQTLSSNSAHSTADRSDSLSQTKDVLEIIFNTGVSLERSSREVKNLPEESLREFFIPPINAKYPDSATPETRNKDGKTDILVRVSGENILIVECKFWGGDKRLKATLDQLLNRYTTVRDTQLAMLIFCRNKNFTDVKKKVSEAMKQHPNFVRETNIDLEKAWYEYVIFHPDDRACELNLTVLAFHLSP